jgi:hypothetical protein
MAAPFDETVLPTAGTNLTASGNGTAPSVVIPDSSFINNQLDDVQSLSIQPLGHELSTDIVIGQAGDDRYRAGMGWEDEIGHNRVKLSLFRQQMVGDEFNGLWLASLQGELTPSFLAEDFDLKGELALADDGSVQQTQGGSGIRLHLLRKPVNDLRYGLTLSQFSAGFHPYDSIVNAGERRTAAHLGYKPWSEAYMAARADYILHDWDGDLPCDNYRTGLSLSTTIFNYLRAKLETSAQRALDCGAISGYGNIDSWALTLSENAWTGWNLNLVASTSEESLPFMDGQRTESHYRVSGDHDIRLGPLWASFSPEVSLQTVSDETVQRRLQTGFVMGIETHTQDFSLQVGYESLTGSAGSIEDNSGNIKLKYRLDFDT